MAPSEGRGGKETGRKEIRLVEGIQAVPGGGKDPWTEGAVSLGVINITDLCNLTHFRSPSATTTTRSIFLPFLLLKPVHPSHPLPSFALPSSLRSSTSTRVYLRVFLLPFVLFESKRQRSTSPNGDEHLSHHSLNISLTLSMGKRIFITTRMELTWKEAFSIFNPRKSFFFFLRLVYDAAVN